MSAGDGLPGITAHAMARQRERWGGAAWPREAWLSVVLQIVDREAVLVRHGNAPGVGGDLHNELWLVATPIGAVRVWWNPNKAQVVTVLAPTDEFNSRSFARTKLRIHGEKANRKAENGHRKERQRDGWRREWEEA